MDAELSLIVQQAHDLPHAIVRINAVFGPFPPPAERRDERCDEDTTATAGAAEETRIGQLVAAATAAPKPSP